MIKTRLILTLVVIGVAVLSVASCSTSNTDVSPAPWPVTGLHYAPNGNFGRPGRYLPGADGFNLADVNSTTALDGLPPGVRGLVWLGLCDGATAAFQSVVGVFAGHPKLFGFYVMDEPAPSTCPPAKLLAEDNWIHTHVPGALTFAVLQNLGPATMPTFAGSYTPRNSGLDLVGIDPYPVRSELRFPAYAEIAQYVELAEASGWPMSSIVPVYQTFGGGNYSDGDNGHWVLPTAAQEDQILAAWAVVVPHPKFDYAYSWGSQERDTALNQSPALRALFAVKNARSNQPTGEALRSSAAAQAP